MSEGNRPRPSRPSERRPESRLGSSPPPKLDGGRDNKRDKPPLPHRPPGPPRPGFPPPREASRRLASWDARPQIDIVGEPEVIIPPRRISRRGLLGLGFSGLVFAVGAALGLRNQGGSNVDAEPVYTPINPPRPPEVAPATAVPPLAVEQPTATLVAPEPSKVSQMPPAPASPVVEAAAAPPTPAVSAASKEVKPREPKEIPDDVLSKEQLEKMNVRILNSPEWDLLIRQKGLELSPTLQWVQNKDADESRVILEKYDAVVKKSLAGEVLTDDERKLISRRSQISRYYPNRSVTYVLVDDSMVNEEAMAPEQREAIPDVVMWNLRKEGFTGGEYLYSPTGTDKRSVECFIFIATKSIWSGQKYTSNQSFPRAGIDLELDERVTDPNSLLHQYPIRAKTDKGGNPTILVRHEDEHIDSDHPETDRRVYRGLESATRALEEGDDTEYYYILVKKDAHGKQEEVIIGQDSNQNGLIRAV